MNKMKQPSSKQGEKLMSERLMDFGVYREEALGKWCFKKQFPGQDVVIVSNEDKEKAASDFFIEYLKSLHYSIRWLYENDRKGELKILIAKMKSFNDSNIDKTIEIVTQSMNL